ncbi:MAG: ABC transporter, permease protein 1 (cluster 5, nickel/peptides/opines) [Candidatus Bipolaricaulis sibiricus]|uniref:ABC transporter, permease protein 1 (Cluster 5, nickel/peptides/opines) n=1 Tax=Bipolaricaulis sibiricus TaxID=2501609 RepID=A0A410FW07_BIPS1|nr:MAG: ABC transporter, permease protein 1 (cluster 5, nickel/peptides/opines) [Candidatus Bipolaricaulis sibiricus]
MASDPLVSFLHERRVIREEGTPAVKGNLVALTRYSLLRALLMGFAVIVALYLVILIVNMGGHLDVVRRGEIRQQVALAVTAVPENQLLPPSELNQIIERQTELAYRRYGLDRPFILRSFDYLTTALSLSLGRSENLTSDSGSRLVRNILLERLPATLVLFGTSSLILFFTSLFAALALSRRYGSWIDRAVVSLAPTSSAPGWFYGIFLILIFAAVLRVLPWGGMVDAPPPKTTLGYAASLIRHMVLPVAAMAAGGLLAAIYARRTFFLIFSSEDYVDLAKAKGLSSRAIERRYILRPTLPTIITQFMFLIIGMWQGAVILEQVFVWPGIGSLTIQAVNLSDTPVIVGVNVIYAYLLALSLFLLEFIYAIVDPRVRIGGGTQRRL